MSLANDIESAIITGNAEFLEELLAQKINLAQILLSRTDLLYQAIRSGYADIIQLFIHSQLNMNIFMEDGYTPLMEAAMVGNLRIVEMLIESGVDANLVTPQGESAIEIAAWNGYQQIFDYLSQWTKPKLRKKAEQNLQEGISRKQRVELVSPSDNQLVEAAILGDVNRVKGFINSGANVNCFNENGYTALDRAAERGNTIIVQSLLEAGANPNVWRQESPLVASIISRNPEVVRALIKAGADINAIVHDRTALMQAAEYSTSEIVQLLIQAGANLELEDQYGNTALMKATEVSYIDRTIAIELLIQAGASGEKLREVDLRRSAKKGDVEKIVSLILAGVNINSQSSGGSTALIIAVERDYLNATQILIELGANVNIKARNGRTALMLAASRNIEIVELLLASEVNIHLKDNDGFSALDFAKINGQRDIMKILKRAGTEG